MSIKESLEKSPIWFIIRVAGSAFFIGLSVTLAAMQVLTQDQAGKSGNLWEKIMQFPIWVLVLLFVIGLLLGISIGIGAMYIIRQHQTKNQSTETYIEVSKQPEPKVEIDRGNLQQDTKSEKLAKNQENVEKKPIEYGSIFRSGDPIPIGFEHIKIGMRLSVLQSIFPNGYIDDVIPRFYKIDINDNPNINRITCRVKYDDENQNDGTLTELDFRFKNSADREYVIKHASSAFGSENAISKLQGKALEWKNVGGFHVEITQDVYCVGRAK
jgi:hypothetical protein